MLASVTAVGRTATTIVDGAVRERLRAKKRLERITEEADRLVS